jgi:LmbE family N-acetylglucosaminyl deacetylase
MTTPPTNPREPMRLMAVLAHPDDESLGIGGTLAKYAAEGAGTYLVTATRGERGWRGDPVADPGLEAFGRAREAELRAAARVLGVRELNLLDYVDGDLDQADPPEAIGKIVAHLRRVRPQVVITFGPEGAYGHPDHIAINQLTTAALVAAADPNYGPDLPSTAHRVAKLYYMANTRDGMKLYTRLFGDLVMQVDGVARTWPGWPNWAITTALDTDAHWRTALRAIQCHASQVSGMAGLEEYCEREHASLLGRQYFIRAMSLVNGGRAREKDLFEGIGERGKNSDGSR